MRQVSVAVFVVVFVTGFWGGRAFGTPFEPATVPEQVGVIGHLDVDALRKTQVFDALGGQAAIDAVLDDAPDDVRPVARALVRTVRGVSFWRDSDHGAVYLVTRDGQVAAQLLRKLPAKVARSIDGHSVYTMGHGDKHGHVATHGDTVVLADSSESLERSLRVLAGKAPSLSGSRKLPSTARQGVFVFVAIGDDLLSTIQKAANAKMLQLAIRSLVVDVGESAGQVIARLRAEMGSADAVQKARSILDGLRALASFADNDKARALVDGMTITSNGLSLEVTAKLPVDEIAKVIQSKKH